jgi:hypothetical protein
MVLPKKQLAVSILIPVNQGYETGNKGNKCFPE